MEAAPAARIPCETSSVSRPGEVWGQGWCCSSGLSSAARRERLHLDTSVTAGSGASNRTSHYSNRLSAGEIGPGFAEASGAGSRHGFGLGLSVVVGFVLGLRLSAGANRTDGPGSGEMERPAGS